MPDPLALYHRLPYPLRVAAATARGFQLRRWRYGPETEELVLEAIDRESWSRGAWDSWQQDRLSRLLHRAATRVPFYKQQWEERRRGGDRSSWEDLDNWPLLKKDDLRRGPTAFVAEDRDVGRMFHERTSGTTGTPLAIFASRATLRTWFALSEARVRRWHGVSLHDRWAMMGGQLVVPFEREKPPYWVLNAAMKQLYLSTHHISERTAGSYVEALRHHRPTHLVAYPSSAAALAGWADGDQLRSLDLKAVLSNAETLLESQRERLSEAFGCPVLDTYGMAEMAAAASECDRRTMHLWPDAGVVEIFDGTEDVPVTGSLGGRLVATGLLNFDMPLIRYDTGDRMTAVPDGSRPCACGRTLPPSGQLQGRSSDMVVTPDGRRVFWLNPVFYGMPVREAQIVQHDLERIEVRMVPAQGFGEDVQDRIVDRLRERVGDLRIDTSIVDEIPRGPSGKFRPVISEIGVF